MGGVNNAYEAYTTNLVSLEVLGLELKGIEVVVHHIHYGIPTDVILGMDILGRQEFCIDSANQLIKLH